MRNLVQTIFWMPATESVKGICLAGPEVFKPLASGSGSYNALSLSIRQIFCSVFLLALQKGSSEAEVYSSISSTLMRKLLLWLE